MSGILLSKAFGRQAYEIDRFRSENRRLSELEIRRTMVGRGFFALVQIFFSIMPAFVYLLAGGSCSGGMLDRPLRHSSERSLRSPRCRAGCSSRWASCSTSTSRSSRGLALFDRIFEYLDLEHDIVDRDGAIELAADRGERRGSLRRRLVPLRPARHDSSRRDDRLWTIGGVDFTAEAGPAGRPRRTLRRREDDAHLSAPSSLRRRPRQREDRRHRRARHPARVARRDHRDGDAGDLPVQRIGPGQPRVRESRRDRRGARGRGAGGAHLRPDHGDARRIRHGRGGARVQDVRWREATPRHRPGHPQGPARS